MQEGNLRSDRGNAITSRSHAGAAFVAIQMLYWQEPESVSYSTLCAWLNCLPWLTCISDRQKRRGTEEYRGTFMRRLKVDLQDLAMAFEDHGFELSNYLDMETGRVVSFSGDDFSECEEDDDELRKVEPGEDDDEGPELTSEPDWIQAEMHFARKSGNGLGTRYIDIPSDDRHEAYRDMEAFIDTVQDSRLQGWLARAIVGRGAFRRFGDALSGNFHERRRWFEFKNARLEMRIREWLESEEIELIEDPLDKERKEQRKAQELVDIRLNLIAEVLDFVGAVRTPGHAADRADRVVDNRSARPEGCRPSRHRGG